MNAYDKIYLDDAMSNLAVMLDYGAIAYGGAEMFFNRFLVINKLSYHYSPQSSIL